MGPATLKLELMPGWWHMTCFEESGESIRLSRRSPAPNIRCRARHVRAAPVICWQRVDEPLQVIIGIRNCRAGGRVNNTSLKSRIPGIRGLRQIGIGKTRVRARNGVTANRC